MFRKGLLVSLGLLSGGQARIDAKQRLGSDAVWHVSCLQPDRKALLNSKRSRQITLLISCLLACGLAACSKDAQKREAVASADAYAASGKNNEAIIEYRRAVQLDPKDGDVRLKLARTFLAVGATSSGLREMLRAGDLLPDNADVQIAIGNLLLTNEKFEDARARADRILQRQPDNVRAHVLRGNALAGLKDLDNALQDMQQAITADSSDPVAYVGLGVVQRARGNLQQAEEAFRKAREVQPSPDIHISYANFLLASGRRPEAEREMKQAYEIDPDSVTVNRALAAFYMMTGQRANVEVHLKKLADNPGSLSWAGFTLARFYSATGRPDDAIRVLKGLLNEKRDKGVPLEARLQLAAVTYNRGQREEAHRLVDEVIAILPKEPRALVLKAGFLLDEGKAEEAVVTARLARQNSRAAQSAIVLGLAYSKLGKIEDARKAFMDALSIDARAISAQIELSRLSLMTGDAEWAQKYGEQALRAAPQLPAAREAVVRAALARKDVAAAGPPLAALRRDRPDDPEFLYLEGELRAQEGKRAEARQAFTRALTLEPRSLATATALIRLELSEGKVGAARARADQVMARSPKSSPAALLAARTYATSNDFTRAEALMRQAIDLDPGRSDAYGMLASLYLVQGRLDDALKHFQDAAKHDPKSVGAWTMIATVLTRQGRQSEAKQTYRQALDIDPEAAVAANNLAFLYAEDGEHLEEAVHLAETAKRRLPGSAAAIDTLGWVYYNRLMPTYAIGELEIAAGIDPRNAAYQYHLGLAYAKGGNTKRARETLERALTLDPKAPLAAQAITALASLKK